MVLCFTVVWSQLFFLQNVYKLTEKHEQRNIGMKNTEHPQRPSWASTKRLKNRLVNQKGTG